MKLSNGCKPPNKQKVAPRAGAWIETKIEQRIKIKLEHVAPRAGAWIETRVCWHMPEPSASLPVRERGLKQRKEY